MKNVIIVGGGTAGWMTALFIQKFFPNVNITLIESDKIGILGAGEGTTPGFPQFLKMVNIDENDFIKETQSTIKWGVEFINWGGDDVSYKHDFLTGQYAFHFNAKLVANYFKKIAINRGLNHVIGNICNVVTDNNNDIVELLLDDNKKYHLDFVFDCSGFNKLILGNIYEPKWKSYQDYLKVNTAIPFFLPRTDTNINMRTEAITMKYGWMWKAPIQGRWGCGYVFDSNMTTEELAIKEIEEYLGHTINSPKTFKFDSGFYQEVWVNNCLSLGLSSGFLEPMEATSLMTVLVQLRLFLKCYPNKEISKFNIHIDSVNEQNMCFIYYHYICDRKDTEFWKFYNDIKNVPIEMSKYFDSDLNFKFKNNTFKYDKLFLNSEPVYSIRSWELVRGGNKKKSGNLI
jgi:tryptophan halogenase